MWTWLRHLLEDERGTSATGKAQQWTRGTVRSSGDGSTFVQTSVPDSLPLPSPRGQLNFTGDIGGGQNPTRGLVSWTEQEVPLVPTRGRASWAELQVPLTPTRGRVSWAETEIPLAPTRGRASWTELEVPLITPTRGRVSWSEFELPAVATRGRLSWTVLLLEEPPVGTQGSSTPTASQPRGHLYGYMTPTATPSRWWDFPD